MEGSRVTQIREFINERCYKGVQEGSQGCIACRQTTIDYRLEQVSDRGSIHGSREEAEWNFFLTNEI